MIDHNRFTSDRSQEFDLLCKLVSRENIEVIVDKRLHTAYFDLKRRTIVLPSWENEDEVVAEMLRGHECAHALYTPAEGWHNAVTQRYPKHKTMFAQYLNVVEDTRIERLLKQYLPGYRRILDEGHKRLFLRGFYQETRVRDFVNQPVLTRLILSARLGPKVAKTLLRNREERRLLAEMGLTETWEDVVELAEKIFEHAKKEAVDTPDMPPMQPPEAGDEEEGEEGEGESVPGEQSENEEDEDGEEESKGEDASDEEADEEEGEAGDTGMEGEEPSDEEEEEGDNSGSADGEEEEDEPEDGDSDAGEPDSGSRESDDKTEPESDEDTANETGNDVADNDERLNNELLENDNELEDTQLGEDAIADLPHVMELFIGGYNEDEFEELYLLDHRDVIPVLELTNEMADLDLFFDL